MQERIRALDEAIAAQANAMAAAATISHVLDRHRTVPGPTPTAMPEEIDEAAAAMLAAAEQMRAALHRFQTMERKIVGGF